MATVSGNALTELTGTRITQLSVFAGNFNIGLVGLDVSAARFFDQAGRVLFAKLGAGTALSFENVWVV